MEKLVNLLQSGGVCIIPTDTVYGYVPVSIVDEVIAKHGGFKVENEN